jgi:DNA repair exonuclease SbcCD ATPase subunit
MMSDQSTYINTYIDYAIETIQSLVKETLQLKTQLKISNGIIAQKEQVIASFNENKKNFETDIDELNASRNNARRWEEQYNAMSQKVSHMDTITAQFNTIKKDYIRKEVECDTLQKEVSKLKEELKLMKKTKSVAGKKDINNKDTKSSAIVENAGMTVEVTNEIDDF